MSLRSLAAARRRSEQPPTQQQPQNYNRTVVTPLSKQHQGQQQQQHKQQQGQQQQQQPNKPFEKLSISDAIGLITLRLGRVEEFMYKMGDPNATNTVPTVAAVAASATSAATINTLLERMMSVEKQLITMASNCSNMSSKLSAIDERIIGLNNSIEEIDALLAEEPIVIEEPEQEQKQEQVQEPEKDSIVIEESVI